MELRKLLEIKLRFEIIDKFRYLGIILISGSRVQGETVPGEVCFYSLPEALI